MAVLKKAVVTNGGKATADEKQKNTEWLFGMSGRATFLVMAVIVLVFCFIDMLVPRGHLIPNYVKYIMVCSLIYAIASLGINFHSGFLGETSLGHAAFFGTGAYLTAYLTTTTNISFWITIPLAMVLAGLFAVPVAWAGRRVKGSFMVVITYAFSEVLRYIAVNSTALGGTAGISGVPTPEIFGVKITKLKFLPSNKDGFILLLFLLVSFFAFFTYRIMKSRVGYAFSAIREDDIAATAMGINVKAYKMQAVVISAVLCTIAGSFYAGFSNFVAPDLLSSNLSITIFTMLVIGGRRSIKGAILGAFIITILPEVLRGVQGLIGLPFDPWYILYGVMLIIMMRFKPEGIFGKKE